MSRKVSIGYQDFSELISKNYFYVDKTLFIKEWWENGDKVTLITRPRRFGKTLAVSMTEKFFSIKHKELEQLFHSLKIWDDASYHTIQGTFPVISLTFANVKERTFQMTRQRLGQILTDLYNKHIFLLEGDLLTPREKEYFRSIHMDMEEPVATMAIHNMCDFLSRYYGQKVIVLLDEYDTPMQEAFVHGYWNELASYMRSLFNAAFKTNPYLERALMTGITRISKASIFSDLNNLEVITTTDLKYADAFGFTDEEVMAALQEYGLEDKAGEIREWYDGFSFGNIKDIYNPWSIINYLDKRVIRTYWANTSSNSLAEKLIREGSKSVKEDFETLLNGCSIHVFLDEQIIYDQLFVKESSIWGLLLASGYLKVLCADFDEKSGRMIYELVLTNKEVKVMFETMIHGWFADYDSGYNDFIKALLQDDVKAMNRYMNRVALNTFSFFDSGKQPSAENEPERFYHGFVLGLLVDLSDRYMVTSNRESGFGRYDVMIEPKSLKDNAIIIEFKVQDSDEKNLQMAVENALKQINDRQYAASLMAKGISENQIYKYGFAFCGKQVLIGKG